MITDEDITIDYDTVKTITKEHVYDDIGRLSSTTIDSDTTTFTYDDVGNRLTKDDGTDDWEEQQRLLLVQ